MEAPKYAVLSQQSDRYASITLKNTQVQPAQVLVLITAGNCDFEVFCQQQQEQRRAAGINCIWCSSCFTLNFICNELPHNRTVTLDFRAYDAAT
jgi:predicted metal-binding protein